MFKSLLKSAGVGAGMWIGKELLSALSKNEEAEDDVRSSRRNADPIPEENFSQQRWDDAENIGNDDARNEMILKMLKEKHRMKMEAERLKMEAERRKEEQKAKEEKVWLGLMLGMMGLGLLVGPVVWLAEHMFVLIGLIVAIALCVMMALVLRHQRLMRQQNIDILNADVNKMNNDEAARRAEKY